MTLPDAEFAPSVLVGYVTEQGGFYRTEAELPLIETAEGEWVTTPSAPVWRQLSCSDPDDMRAIWRRAALALGATEEEAMTAHLGVVARRWYLLFHGDDGRRDNIDWASPFADEADIKHATAALCRAVWGPR